MDELITWLRGVLDEDENRYRGALEDWQPPEEWDSGDAVDDMHHWQWVLADIAAKRAILDLHNAAVARVSAPLIAGDRPSMVDAEIASALQRTARLLASAYADRPGYRSEWRP